MPQSVGPTSWLDSVSEELGVQQIKPFVDSLEQQRQQIMAAVPPLPSLTSSIPSLSSLLGGPSGASSSVNPPAAPGGTPAPMPQLSLPTPPIEAGPPPSIAQPNLSASIPDLSSLLTPLRPTASSSPATYGGGSDVGTNGAAPSTPARAPAPASGGTPPVRPDEPVTSETVTRSAAAALERAGLPTAMAPYLAGIAINEGILVPGTIARDHWSVGGVKAGGTAGSVTVPTREVVNGQSVMQTASFGTFNSMQEGMDALAAFVRDSPRFGPVVANAVKTGDYAGMIEGMRQQGYATDPDWTGKVTSIARGLPVPTAPSQTPTAAASETSGAQGAKPTSDIAQSALDDPDKWALCGPVAATIAAQRYGPNWTVAQAKQIAVENGLWDPSVGMHGLESQVTLLKKMGIGAASGPADQQRLAQDAQSGNTPIISTNRHYFILQGYDPQTGRFDTGTTGTVLKGGSRYLTLDQIASLGGGIQGAAYLDNPTSPTPSVVAGSSAPQAQAQPAPDDRTMYRQPLGQPSDTPPPDGGVSSTHEAGRFIPTPNYEPTGPAMRGVTPDVAYPRPGQRNRAVPGGDVTELPGPSVDPTYYGRNRAVPGDTAEWREGGWATPPDPASGGPYGLGTPLSYRQALTPTAQADPSSPPPTGPAGAPPNPDQGPHESGYRLSPGTPIPIQNADGSVSTELSITVTDPRLNGGRPTNIPSVWGGLRQSEDDAIEFATRSGIDWPSFNSIKQAEQAARQRSYDLGTGAQTSVGGASGVAPADRRNQAVPGVVDEQGGGMLPSGMSYRQPLDGSSTQDFLPGDGGTAPEQPGQRPYDPDQGPHELPPPDLTPRPRSQVVPDESPPPVPDYRTPASPLVTAPEQPAPAPVAQTDALGTSTAANPLKPVWDAAGNAIGYVRESGGQGLLGEAARTQEEKDRANAYAMEQAGITNAPAGAAPFLEENVLKPARDDVARWQELSGKESDARLGNGPPLTPDEQAELARLDVALASGTVAGVGNRLARTGFVDEAGRLLRPTAEAGRSVVEPIIQGANRLGAHLAENRAGVAALDAERAARPGVATYGTLGFSPAEQEMRGLTRTPVVPPDVAVGLGVERRIPEDPRLAQAVEASGGTITDRGVELNLTRAQGEGAAGRPASRGGVFYEAVPEGGRSNYAKSGDNPLGVGGSQVIPPAPTVIRSPLVLDAAPGEAAGFNQRDAATRAQREPGGRQGAECR
jgi:hypothetical protein